MESTDRLELAIRVNHLDDDWILYSNDSYAVIALCHVAFCVFGRNCYNKENDPIGFEATPNQIIELISSGKKFEEYIDDNNINANNTRFLLLNEAYVDRYGEQWIKSRKKRLFSKPVQLIDPKVIEDLRAEIEKYASHGGR